MGIDINSEAVANTKVNLSKYKLENVQILESNVFENEKIPKNYFDIIYWNYPFHPTDKPTEQLGKVERGVRDPAYTGLHKLFQEGKNFLKENGTIYLGFSQTMADMKLLKVITEKYNISFEVMGQTNEEGTIIFVGTKYL